MLKKAALSIAVIQKEGSALTTLKNANIVCTDIKDALELLINPQRLIATLRD
jgi:soluble P-type ATPase